MTAATRNALEQVSQILHEAGWDQPSGTAKGVTGPTDRQPGEDVEGIRRAYGTLLRSDHSTILRLVLQEGSGMREAGVALGLSEAEAGEMFTEALQRLRDFVATYEGTRSGPDSTGHTAGSSRSPKGI